MHRTLGTMMLVIPTHTLPKKLGTIMLWMSRNERLLYRDAFKHRSFYTQKL